MPAYEFQCQKCQEVFTVFLSLAEHGQKRPACPKCKGRKLTQLLGGVSVITSKKS
ncbi:MAG: zinc ribbon domain-containing protein [Pseudomonadota bacterium]